MNKELIAKYERQAEKAEKSVKKAEKQALKLGKLHEELLKESDGFHYIVAKKNSMGVYKNAYLAENAFEESKDVPSLLFTDNKAMKALHDDRKGRIVFMKDSSFMANAFKVIDENKALKAVIVKMMIP